MAVEASHVQQAFEVLRTRGIEPNSPSTKWDVIDPETSERFPPKAVLRVAKELAEDRSRLLGGGWPTNDPLKDLGFEIALKPHLESSSTAADIEDVLASKVDETTKQRLVNARLGQGGFREALLEIWDGQCAVTGCKIEPVLRASHIKSWRESDNRERLDPDNGVLLAASLDALFDRCLITFSKTGHLRVSASIPKRALENLGFPAERRVDFSPKVQSYLDWHRRAFERISDGDFFDY